MHDNTSPTSLGSAVLASPELVLPCVLAIATLVSVAITPLVIRVAAKLGLYDRPDSERHIHARPVPRLGGVAIVASASLALLGAAVYRFETAPFAPAQERLVLGVLLGGGMLFAAGLVDDLRGVRPAAKLATQCVAALVVYWCGLRVQILSLGP